MKLKGECERLSPDILYFDEDDLYDFRLKGLNGLLKYPEIESRKEEQSWYNSSLEKELEVEQAGEKELLPNSVFCLISEQEALTHFVSSASEELNGKQIYVTKDDDDTKKNEGNVMDMILKQKQTVKNGLIKYKDKLSNQNQNYNLHISDKYAFGYNSVEKKENWTFGRESVLSERQQIRRSFHIHNRKEECEICNESGILEEDECFSHPRKMLLSCEVCNKEFSSKLILDDHKCSHIEGKQTTKIVNFSQSTEIPLSTENETKKNINQKDIVYVVNFSHRFKIPLNTEF